MSASNPTIAAVIASYNYARYLPQTLDSVLAQTPAFDEIVVVDDGSTDDSMKVLARYSDRVVILSIPNGGQLGAYRAGINATTSEYIYTLDSDDFIVPNTVSRLHAALAERPAKLQFQLRGVDDEGASLDSTFPTYPRFYDAASMRQDNAALGFYICAPTSGNVFSRRALQRLDLDAFDSRGSIDSTPALAMPYLGEIVSLNEPLVSYRVHEGSESGWSKPTTALLRREIRLFDTSWREVLQTLAFDTVPGARAVPLYTREREMMIACLDGALFVGHLVWSYTAQLWRTHLPLKQKLLLSLWASALLVPSVGLRRYCIRVKRSSVNRPRVMQTVLKLFTGVRSLRGSGSQQLAVKRR